MKQILIDMGKKAAVFDPMDGSASRSIKRAISPDYIMELQQAIGGAGGINWQREAVESVAGGNCCHILPYLTDAEFKGLCKTLNCLKLRDYQSIDYEMVELISRKIYREQAPVSASMVEQAAGQRFVLKMQMVPVIGAVNFDSENIDSDSGIEPKTAMYGCGKQPYNKRW